MPAMGTMIIRRKFWPDLRSGAKGKKKATSGWMHFWNRLGLHCCVMKV